MTPDQKKDTRRRPMRGLFRRLLARRDGATAIEFSLLCIPFFMIVFASVETFVAFSAEQLLVSATDTMARKLRTGEITYNLGRSTDMTETQFRKAFCDEIAIVITCSAEEIKKPEKLLIDVRSFAKFVDIPRSIPVTNSVLDTGAFRFAPGGKKSINIVRAYYHWQIVTDVIRPFISNVRSADGSQRDYLMIATTVVQNEEYP